MKRVLLADDEASSSEIIKYFIQQHNLPLEVVGEVETGLDTVQAVKQLQPDIVFLDIEMPCMNGLQVIEKLGREYFREISFIIVTAYSSFEYIQKALRLGAADYLLKPVLYDQFCDTMARVVGYRYSENPFFNRLIEYMQHRFAEDTTLMACARELGSSESNIARLLRNEMKTTFTEYRNELRIERAKELLRAGCSVKDAAERVGYNNLTYFYRVFKKKAGETPKEFLNVHTLGESNES